MHLPKLRYWDLREFKENGKVDLVEMLKSISLIAQNIKNDSLTVHLTQRDIDYYGDQCWSDISKFMSESKANIILMR